LRSGQVSAIRCDWIVYRSVRCGRLHGIARFSASDRATPIAAGQFVETSIPFDQFPVRRNPRSQRLSGPAGADPTTVSDDAVTCDNLKFQI
jgi:hypothetical protein